MYKTLINNGEEQADVMLNYLPLRNVLTYGIKATVKTKALPDPGRPCKHPRLVTLSLSLSLSLSLAIHPDTWLYQSWSHVSSLANAVHLESTPWILPRLDPGKKLKYI